jgi:hypothetical protein
LFIVFSYQGSVIPKNEFLTRVKFQPVRQPRPEKEAEYESKSLKHGDEHEKLNDAWRGKFGMECIADGVRGFESAGSGFLVPSRIFKRLDLNNDGFVNLKDLKNACQKYRVPLDEQTCAAVLHNLDTDKKGSVNMKEFLRTFETHGGSILNSMQREFVGVRRDGKGIYRAVKSSTTVDDVSSSAAESTVSKSSTCTGSSRNSKTTKSKSVVLSDVSSNAKSKEGSGRSHERRHRSSASHISSMRSLSNNHDQSSSGASVISGLSSSSSVAASAPLVRVTDVIRSRIKREFIDDARHHPTRYGLTIYPNTKHITEPLNYGAGVKNPALATDHDRHRTSYQSRQLWSLPDPLCTSALDKHHAAEAHEFKRLFNANRIAEMSVRETAKNEAAKDYDKKRILKKKQNLANYEKAVMLGLSS